ncbi:MAG: hypothetical protein Q9220_006940 [cf. Caloplaca sp. 1 TL-2023]
MWLIQHNGLYSAPLATCSKHHQRVLDIGCGTGNWAIAYATEHPNAQVTGLDIIPPQPKSAVPANCSFVVADAESDDWGFAELRERFDFIHGRMLAISIRDWPAFIKRCHQRLKPGGWLELNDVALRFFAEDGSGEAEAPMLKWWRVVFQASARANGIDIDATYKHAQQMRDVGLIDVRERVFKWPVGGNNDGESHASWGYTPREREIAGLQMRALPVLVEGVTATALQRGDLQGVMSKEEVCALAEDARRDLVERAAERGYYMHFATFVGQVPFLK